MKRMVWWFGIGVGLGVLAVAVWAKKLSRVTPDVLRSAGFLALVLVLGCGTEPAPLQPQEGEYAIVTFRYTNDCWDDGATLVLDYANAVGPPLRWYIRPVTDIRGLIDVAADDSNGTFRVRYTWDGTEQITTLLVAPLYMQYGITSRDTLYILDVSPALQGDWLTLLGFGVYRDGELFATLPYACGVLELGLARVGPLP